MRLFFSPERGIVMLQTQTVEAGTLDLIKTLMNDAELSAFNLVGGTALSLMIGHRKSVDIDLFTSHDFDAGKLADHLSKQYHAQNIKTLKNGVFSFIEDVKVDLIAHQYPILKPLIFEEGIRMFSLEDIGAMKLNAILNNGSRLKDFVDMYFLLEKMTLVDITSGFVQKYPDVNTQMAHTALLYHQDINTKEKIEFLDRDISLDKMAVRFQMVVRNPSLAIKAELQQLLNQENKIIKLRNQNKPRL
ncbi:nucleotidyl transferase AbiEii/AbiGii toxin family protein [Chitinophagaceae bacterium 26-R-25]|nr:nucleotidyl transferase AbiEii/AbiGii toxin family protein [Chitinophagaceae bacterium 26-R-25]